MESKHLVALLALVATILVGCAPAAATPTTAPAKPTTAPPTAAPAQPTSAPAQPTAASKPAATTVAPAAQAPAPAKPSSTKNLQIGGAGVGQFGYFIATGWAQVINAHAPGYNASAVATSGFTENAQLIVQNKMELGFVSGYTFDCVRAGTCTDVSKDELNSLRAVFTVPAGAHHIIVAADSPIKSLADVAGKKVAGFGRGSLGWSYVNDILMAAGLPKNGFQENDLGPAQAAQGLRDGSVDVFWAIGQAPVAAVTQLAATNKFRLIPVPDAILQKLVSAAPSWQKAVVKKDAYGANMVADADVTTIQQTSVASTNVKQDPDLVYAATWAVMDYNKEFAAVNPGAANVGIPTAFDGMPAPLHAGAVRYYKAKGVQLADRLVPAEAR